MDARVGDGEALEQQQQQVGAGPGGPAVQVGVNPQFQERVEATYRIPKLSSFFREDPGLWFAQAELAFEYAHLRSERARAGAVMPSLDCKVLQFHS